MKQLASKLPFKLQEKQARIIQDPVFRDIQDSTGGAKPRKPKTDLMHIKSYNKKSFVTAATPVIAKADANIKERGDKLMGTTTINMDASNLVLSVKEIT